MADEPIPVLPSPAVDIGELEKRLVALERMGLTPRYVGELIPFAGQVPGLTGEQEIKPGFLLANGADVPAATWPDLAAELANLYGTPAGGLIRLPDLRGRSPFGQATSGSLNTLGATGGETTHILATGEMPPHQHAGSSLSGAALSGATALSAGDHSHTFNGGSRTPMSTAAGSADITTGAGSFTFFRTGTTMDTAGAHSHTVTGTVTGTVAIAPEGSGTAHQNMPPYQVVAGWLIYAGRKAA